MKPTAFLLTLALAAGISARSCTGGKKYCASTLRAIGNYDSYIAAAMGRINDYPESADSFLFDCTHSVIGTIEVDEFCKTNKCHDAGPGNDDYCEPEPIDPDWKSPDIGGAGGFVPPEGVDFPPS